MAKNLIQNGDVVTMVAPGTLTSGLGVLVGSSFGVALTDAASGADVQVALTGVWTLPKLSTDTIDPFQKVYWDAANARVTETKTSNYLIGVATATAGNGAATVPVRLNGIAITVEAS